MVHVTQEKRIVNTRCCASLPVIFLVFPPRIRRALHADPGLNTFSEMNALELVVGLSVAPGLREWVELPPRSLRTYRGYLRIRTRSVLREVLCPWA